MPIRLAPEMPNPSTRSRMKERQREKRTLYCITIFPHLKRKKIIILYIMHCIVINYKHNVQTTNARCLFLVNIEVV